MRKYKRKIALHNGDKTKFPNFVLMKISTYHKSLGHDVEWFNPEKVYDKVYSSKVMSASPVDPQLPKSAILGGTGYGDIKLTLPPEIDAVSPDYSIYPDVDYAIGFLTRGCVHNCDWCCVPEKEGLIRPYSSWEEVKRIDSKNIVFMDNNVLASPWGLEQIERMSGQDIKVDFNQGLDARLITRENAKRLAKLKWYKPLRMSCDTAEMLYYVERATNYLREENCTPRNYFIYTLIKEVDDEAELRILKLEHLKLDPFAMAYRDLKSNIEPCTELKAFARWINNKAAFRATTWQNYSHGKWEGAYKKYPPK